MKMGYAKPISHLSVREIEEELKKLKLWEEQLRLRREHLLEQNKSNLVVTTRMGFDSKGFVPLIGVAPSEHWDPDPN
jgi:hypothetical protein